MSQADMENIERSIMVTIERSTTSRAVPMSYCETFKPSRATRCDAPATGTGLRTERFIHFREPDPAPNGFISELLAKGRPAGIEDGFRQSGFRQLRRRYIPDNDVIKLFYDASGSLMVEIQPRILDTGMNIRGLSFFARPLGFRHLLGQLCQMARIFYFLTCGQRGEIVEPEINTDGLADGPRRYIGKFQDHVEEPSALRVHGKIGAIANPCSIWNRTAIKYTKDSTGKLEITTMTCNVTSLDWNPSQRFTPAPAEIGPFLLPSAIGVLRADGIDGPRVEAKFLACPGSQVIKIEASGPTVAKPKA